MSHMSGQGSWVNAGVDGRGDRALTPSHVALLLSAEYMPCVCAACADEWLFKALARAKFPSFLPLELFPNPAINEHFLERCRCCDGSPGV